MAQSTLPQGASLVTFSDGMELFHNKKYSAARQVFEGYTNSHASGEDRTIQARYYAAICALRLDSPEFETLMSSLIEDHPTHMLALRGFADVGSYYYKQGDYRKAVHYFEKAGQLLDTDSPEGLERSYEQAYAYFQIGNEQKARRYFEKIKKGEHAYAFKASYYAGYLAYQANDLSTALKDLQKASRDEEIRPDTYLMIANIFYKQGKYDEVVAFTEGLEHDGVLLSMDLKLVAGEAYFQLRNYRNTLTYMAPYVDEIGTSDRSILYRLGYANFYQYNKLKQDKYLDRASDYLERAANGEDGLAQVAAYHLGVCYLSNATNESNRQEVVSKLNQATIAFDQCRRLSADPILQEKGAYYFAKVAYDAKDYLTAIEGSQVYLDSGYREHQKQINNILVQSYRNTGDYDKTISYFEKSISREKDIMMAYQEATYNKASLLLNDEKYEEALQWLKRSVEYGTHNKALSSKANFWIGEIYAQQKDSVQAVRAYEKVSTASDDYARAMFGLAYIHFNGQNYTLASQGFASYINMNRDKLDGAETRKAEAYVRIADCHYVNKSFENAKTYYESGLKLSKSSFLGDYAKFQMADMYERENDNERAIKYYSELSERQSELAAPALLRLSEVYLKRQDYWHVVQNTSKLLAEHPQLNQEVQLQAIDLRIQANKKLGDAAGLIEDYKRILREAADSKYAVLADTGLENLSSNMKPDTLAYYRKLFAQANPDDKSRYERKIKRAQSLMWGGSAPSAARYAEAATMLKEVIAALNSSDQKDWAYYVLGEIYEKQGQFDQSIATYDKIERSNWKLKALRKKGDILYFEKKDYEAASHTYLKLRKSLPEGNPNLKYAFMGLMRSYYMLKDMRATLTYAEALIGKNGSEGVIDKVGFQRDFYESELYRGKAYLYLKQYESARASFYKVTQEVNGSQAAEAGFLIGRLLYLKGDKDKSLKELELFIKEYRAELKWVFEAFLLRAEIFDDQGKEMLAKRSVQAIAKFDNDKKRISDAEAAYYRRKAQAFIDRIDQREEARKQAEKQSVLTSDTTKTAPKNAVDTQ
ncbi:tetratricopeptide repeat protein [Algivirga pacifica]|uniref:Tetratricopeptide repeat protein n=2 Tax=Algivirga pacifica TaxID=1162670 RepID=A0ABP9D810_9BACT